MNVSKKLAQALGKLKGREPDHLADATRYLSALDMAAPPVQPKQGLTADELAKIKGQPEKSKQPKDTPVKFYGGMMTLNPSISAPVQMTAAAVKAHAEAQNQRAQYHQAVAEAAARAAAFAPATDGTLVERLMMKIDQLEQRVTALEEGSDTFYFNDESET